MAEKHSKDGIFTRADIIRIRKGIGAGIPTEKFAKEFKVSGQCIRDLARGITHADMNVEAPPVEVSGKHLKTERRRKRVLEKLAQGIRPTDIAREEKISQTLVTLIAKGER